MEPDVPAVTTLDGVMALHDARVSMFRARPFFACLTESNLRDERKRGALLACMQRFSSNFQTLLFIRQGLCVDPRYERIFSRHLREEFGHDSMLTPEQREPQRDTLFEAMLGWFNYQMLALDNAERAALHLVLETSADLFWGIASPKIAPYIPSRYLAQHVELDPGHVQLAVDLLAEHTATTYARIARVMNESWDMMDAVMERARQLIEEGVS